MGSIQVNSSIRRAYPPDVVKFDIHIGSINDDTDALIEYNKSVIEDILVGIRELEIDEDNFKEEYFRISANREYQDGAYKDNGYKLDSSYSVSTYIDYDLIAKIRSLLASLNLEFSVSYSLEDESDIRDLLLAEAVKKSHSKAKVIAKAGGMDVGEMKDVRYNDVNPAPMMLRGTANTRDEATPRDIEVSESVEVEWELID